MTNGRNGIKILFLRAFPRKPLPCKLRAAALTITQCQCQFGFFIWSIWDSIMWFFFWFCVCGGGVVAQYDVGSISQRLKLLGSIGYFTVHRVLELWFWVGHGFKSLCWHLPHVFLLPSTFYFHLHVLDGVAHSGGCWISLTYSVGLVFPTI